MPVAKDRKTGSTTLEPIFEYLAILHSKGTNSTEAQQFKASHWDNKKFRQLSKGAERLFEEKDEILAALDELDAQPANR